MESKESKTYVTYVCLGCGRSVERTHTKAECGHNLFKDLSDRADRNRPKQEDGMEGK